MVICNNIFFHVIKISCNKDYTAFVDSRNCFPCVIRIVIILSKIEFGDENESDINFKSKKVNNAYLSKSLIIMILGFVLSSVGLIILYKIRKRGKNEYC